MSDLFYNIPVRRLAAINTATAELDRITECVARVALAFPRVSISLTDSQHVTRLLQTRQPKTTEACFAQLFGQRLAQDLHSVAHEISGYAIHGVVSVPKSRRPAKDLQFFCIQIFM